VKADRFHVGKERAREIGEEMENPAMEDGELRTFFVSICPICEVGGKLTIPF